MGVASGEPERAEVGAGPGVRRLGAPQRRRRALIAVACCGWVIALVAAWWCWQTASEVRFTAATAIGLAEAEVRARAGPPDMVIAGDEAMESGRLAGYLRSAKPVEQRVLVYFRYGHAVLVYIGRDGYVSTVYWAQPR